MALPGQNGVPHHHVDVYTLDQGHPLEEVQILFLISLWLDLILLKFYMKVPISSEPFKIPEYLVMQDLKKKLIFLGLKGKRYPVKESLAFLPTKEPEFLILSSIQFLQLREERNTQLNIIVKT